MTSFLTICCKTEPFLWWREMIFRSPVRLAVGARGRVSDRGRARSHASPDETEKTGWGHLMTCRFLNICLMTRLWNSPVSGKKRLRSETTVSLIMTQSRFCVCVILISPSVRLWCEQNHRTTEPQVSPLIIVSSAGGSSRRTFLRLHQLRPEQQDGRGRRTRSSDRHLLEPPAGSVGFWSLCAAVPVQVQNQNTADAVTYSTVRACPAAGADPGDLYAAVREPQ